MVRVRADCNGASGNSRPLTPRRAFVIRQITPKQTPTARRQAAMRQIEFVSFSTAEQARVRALSSCMPRTGVKTHKTKHRGGR